MEAEAQLQREQQQKEKEKQREKEKQAEAEYEEYLYNQRVAKEKKKKKWIISIVALALVALIVGVGIFVAMPREEKLSGEVMFFVADFYLPGDKDGVPVYVVNDGKETEVQRDSRYVSWETEDRDIAYVNKSGYLVAVSPGATRITCHYSNRKVVKKVVVAEDMSKETNGNSLKIKNVSDVELEVGKSKTVKIDISGSAPTSDWYGYWYSCYEYKNYPAWAEWSGTYGDRLKITGYEKGKMFITIYSVSKDYTEVYAKETFAVNVK